MVSKITPIAVLGFVLASVHCAEACLGDAPDQADKRYGKAIFKAKHESGRIHEYKFKGYEVTVLFLTEDGKSHMETFTKRNKAKISRAEAKKLLELDSDGGTWEWIAEDSTTILWKREDGAYALLDLEDEPTFIFASSKMSERIRGRRPKANSEQ